MSDPIRLARPDVGDDELDAVAEVMRTGQLTMGPKVAEFEAAVARAVGTARGIDLACASHADNLGGPP